MQPSEKWDKRYQEAQFYIQKSPQRKLGDDDLYPLVVAKGHECDISTQQALCKVVSTLEALLYVTGYAPFSRRTANSPVKVTTSMRNWGLRWALAPWLLLLGATLSGDGPWFAAHSTWSWWIYWQPWAITNYLQNAKIVMMQWNCMFFFCDQRLLAVMSLAFGSLVSSRPSWHRLKLNLSPAAAAAWIPTNGQPSKEWTPWPRAHQRPNVKSLDIVDLSRLSTQMTNQLDVLSSWFLSKFRSFKLVDLVWSCHILFHVYQNVIFWRAQCLHSVVVWALDALTGSFWRCGLSRTPRWS